MADKGDQIFKIFLDNFNNVQKSNFTPDNNTPLESLYLYQYIKSSYYGKFPKEISSETNGDEYKFKLNNGKYDLLESVSIRAEIPMIRVKAEYEDSIQIRWDDDLAINICESGKLIYGTTQISNIDKSYIYLHSQTYTNESNREFFNNCIGNKHSLTQWNTFLPNDVVLCEQPWSYGRKKYTALPLYYCNSQLDAIHIYKFKTDISQLLRMRRLNPETEEYERIDFDSKYIWVRDNLEKLKTPKMFGIYTKLTTEEVEDYKCMTRDGSYGDFYFTDIIQCSSKNSSVFNKIMSVDLECDGVANTLIWFAENETALKKTVNNNFTTNSENRYLGYDPIESTTLKINSLELFKNLPAEYTSKMFFKDFPGKPWIPGIHVFSFCSDVNGTDSQVGVNLRDIKIVLDSKIRDTNPFLETLNPETGKTIKLNSDENPDFNLYVYLVVNRKITFVPSKDRVNDKWEIELDNPHYRRLPLESDSESSK
jgi:hypothetical protein